MLDWVDQSQAYLADIISDKISTQNPTDLGSAESRSNRPNSADDTCVNEVQLSTKPSIGHICYCLVSADMYTRDLKLQ